MEALQRTEAWKDSNEAQAAAESHARSSFTPKVKAPYPGLRPFEEDEWPIFFGREKITHQIIRRLTSNQIIVIHGSSGCGKSSFVRAGVLARLDRECAREGLHWHTSAMRPGNSPLWNLAEAIAHIKNPDGPPPSIGEIRAVRQQLNLASAAFPRITQDLGLGPERQACILLDQFEELFRYAQEIGLDEAEAFAKAICAFATSPPEGLHFIITLRTDYLADCSQFAGLAEVVNKDQYLLPRLDKTDLIRAIRQPATLCQGEVELDLAMKLLHDSEGEVDALPLMQHCLMRMWQQIETKPGPKVLRLAQYPGLRQGLSTHADEILAGILEEKDSHGAQPSLEKIELLFSSLTMTDANGRHIRRPQTFGQLLDMTEFDEATLNAMLRPFRERSAGFVMPQGTHDLQKHEVVDVSHEAFIRHWIRLAGSPSEPGWIQTEDYDGRRYRALLEFLPGPLPSAKADEWIAWWERRPRTAKWAERHGGEFHQVQQLIDATKRQAEEAQRQVEERRRQMEERQQAARRKRHRRNQRLATFGVVIALCIVALQYSWNQRELHSLQNARAVSLASIGEQVLSRDGATRALLVALEGLRNPEESSNLTEPERVPVIPKTQRLAYKALQDLREKYIVPVKGSGPPQVSFSPRSDLLLIGRTGGSLQFMKTATGEIIEPNAVTPELTSMMLVKWTSEQDGVRLVVAGQDGLVVSEQDQRRTNAVLVLDPCRQDSASTLPGCQQGKVAVGSPAPPLRDPDPFRTVSPDGRYALSGGWGAQKTKLWNLQERREVKEFPPSFNSTFNSDSTLFALVLNDRISVFNAETLAPVAHLTAAELGQPGWRPVALAFGPANTPMAGKLFAASNNKARLWDLGTARPENLPDAMSSTFQAVFSPTGDAVAATLDSWGAVQVWHWREQGEGPASFLLQGHSKNVWSIDFSPDGRWIATGSNDGTARLWSLRSAMAPQLLSAPEHVSLNRKSANGMRLDNRNGTLTVLDETTGEPLVLFSRATSRKWRDFGFVAEGVRAVTEDGRTFMWKVFSSPDELARFGREHLPRCGGQPVSLTDHQRANLLGLKGSQQPTLSQTISPSFANTQGRSQEPDCSYGSPYPEATTSN
ncbi:MAG TPA: AAA family ATPase [Beijerinckiaceae bacterium]|jgi:WD40 repeat protein